MTPSKKHILVVDDDVTLCQMYKDVLAKAGFEVGVVHDGIDALQLLLEKKHYDLLVVDVMMAKMDGWSLLRAIREELKLSETELPVIIVSAFASDEVEFLALKNRANAWFIKPIRPLSRLVERAKIFTGVRDATGD